MFCVTSSGCKITKLYGIIQDSMTSVIRIYCSHSNKGGVRGHDVPRVVVTIP